MYNSVKRKAVDPDMKKRIFAACLAVMVMILSMVTCFAAEDADALIIKNAAYDNNQKNLSFDVANTTGEELIFAVAGFTYDESQVVIGKLQKELSVMAIEPGGEVAFTLPVEIPSYNKETLPKFGITMQYMPANSTDIDLTKAAGVQEIKIDNIFAPAATPMEAIVNFLNQTGFMAIANNWKVAVMLLISFVLLYLAIVKKFEPLLLLPIAFGMLLTNLPGADMFHEELFADGHVHWELFSATNAITPGLIDILYLGVKLGIYPCLIFLGVGAMTDFGPLIANPKSLLLGAAAQLGIFMTYIAAASLFGFNSAEAGSIGIIGGADGPTAIFVTTKLAPHLLGPIAVAAYSYMALVPVIQPPIMKLLTTKKERQIVMRPLREVSKTEKIVFPIAITVFVTLLVPSAGPLVGCLMLGNLARECGVVDRISKTAQNELMNIVTIFLGISVGATATADTFLQFRTIAIIVMGVVAFGFGTAGGVLLAKFMNLFLKNKINPLIGSAGVSAVPMAARVSQVVGQKENPQNFLLMHAMGPNVAGVIGSAIAAGVLIALFG